MWNTCFLMFYLVEVSSICNIVYHILQVHRGKLRFGTWLSFSIRGFLGSMLIFQGCTDFSTSETADIYCTLYPLSPLISFGLAFWLRLHSSHRSAPSPSFTDSRDDYDSVSHRWSSALACAWTEASGSQICNSRNHRLPPQKNEKQLCWSCAVLMLLFWHWIFHCLWLVSNSPLTIYKYKTKVHISKIYFCKISNYFMQAQTPQTTAIGSTIKHQSQHVWISTC